MATKASPTVTRRPQTALHGSDLPDEADQERVDRFLTEAYQQVWSDGIG